MLVPSYMESQGCSANVHTATVTVLVTQLLLTTITDTSISCTEQHKYYLFWTTQVLVALDNTRLSCTEQHIIMRPPL